MYIDAHVSMRGTREVDREFFGDLGDPLISRGVREPGRFQVAKRGFLRVGIDRGRCIPSRGGGVGEANGVLYSCIVRRGPVSLSSSRQRALAAKFGERRDVARDTIQGGRDEMRLNGGRRASRRDPNYSATLWISRGTPKRILSDDILSGDVCFERRSPSSIPPPPRQSRIRDR